MSATLARLSTPAAIVTLSASGCAYAAGALPLVDGHEHSTFQSELENENVRIHRLRLGPARLARWPGETSTLEDISLLQRPLKMQDNLTASSERDGKLQ